MTATTTLKLKEVKLGRKVKVAATSGNPGTEPAALESASDEWARHACASNGFGGAVGDEMTAEDSCLPSAA